MATFAVTGATGFIGRALTNVLVGQGHSIHALTRHPTGANSRSIVYIRGTLEDRASLEALIEGTDGVIHLAGLTAALNRNAYFKTNAAGTAQLLSVLEAQTTPIPLVHISSLAAREPHLSDYSASKHAGETLVQSTTLPWTMIRPPAVYGPNDAALRPLWWLMKKGLLPAIGARHGRFSLIHVDDLAEAISHVALLLMKDDPASSSPKHQIFEIDDQFTGELGQGYGWDDLATIAEAVFGRRPAMISVPRPILSSLAALSQGAGALRRTPSVFNLGKARELSHLNWVTHSPPNWANIGWSPCRQLRDTLAYLSLSI
ncbi:MAG TPA: NAD-dependent epimerase/dehydratase family protein [Wenzhouxiangella sp.]